MPGRYLRLEYPGLPPESYSANSTAHWRKRHRDNRTVRDDMCALIAEAAAQDRWPGGPMQKAKVTVTVVFPVNRRRDADNLKSRCKPLMDALAYWGVLVDDNYDVIGEPEVKPLVEKGVSKTIIEIQELK